MFEERDDVLDFRTIRHLRLDLVDNIEHAGLSMEQQTVGIGNVFLYLFINTSKFQDLRVHTAILHRSASGNNVGRHIVGEGTTSLYQRQVTSTRIGILNGSGREDDTVADDAVACYLDTITKHAVGTYYGVVTDMGAFQQEVMITYRGTSLSVGSAIDNHILTNHIIVAYLNIRLLTTIVEILWQGSNHGSLVYLVVIADASTIQDGHEGHDDAIVANLYIILDIHEGEYLTIIAYFRLWRYLGFWTYFTCHNYIYIRSKERRSKELSRKDLKVISFLDASVIGIQKYILPQYLQL